MDRRLLNGKPKVTVIQRFNHTVVVIGPDVNMKREFPNLEVAKQMIQKKGWEIKIDHIHPGQVEKV